MDAPFPRRHRGARVEMHSSTEKERSARMKITTIGVDLAKSLLQVHGVDEHGKVVLRKQLKRKDVLSFFANLEPCLVGMEACGSAHYWARKLAELGHTVRLIGATVCKGVREDEQERPQRCRGDLRGGGAAEYALRPGEDGRAAGAAGGTPSAPGIGEGTYRAGQPDSRPARRVRDRDSQGYRAHCQTVARDPGRRRQRAYRNDARVAAAAG